MVTRAALMTSRGRGAIAVVRVWGPSALAAVDSVFQPNRGKPLRDTAPGRPRLGRVGGGLGDEVVALIVPGTPPEVEIQCHGGPVAVELVSRALADVGVIPSHPHRWIRSRYPSRDRAGAASLLPHATTTRAAEILLDQVEGALERDWDVVPTDELLRRCRIGLRLVSGFRVVLAGRPNVGKSRLLNALAGYDRAIVDPTPGTTRDVVTARTAFDGWPVELADTAGLRAAPDELEALGVAKAMLRQAGADLVLLVLDRSEPPTDRDRELIETYPEALVVANKIDRPSAWDPPGIPVSAERGDGIEALATEIARRLVPDPPKAGAGVPFRPRHARLLSRRK